MATASAGRVDALTATLVESNTVPLDALTTYRAQAARMPPVDLERLAGAAKQLRDIGATVRADRSDG